MEPTDVDLSRMARAIDNMKRSISEPRDDKTSPTVGVVAVLADGTLVDAYRGELRDGDHAEFTLFERKGLNLDFSGSTLYVTLEPCAPGARSSPKVACARRVAAARVKTVWIGAIDPDPSVQGKGVEYLESKGIEVKYFPRPLGEEIRSSNREFFDEDGRRTLPAEPTVGSWPSSTAYLRQPSSIAIDQLSSTRLRALAQLTRHSYDSDDFWKTMIDWEIATQSNGTSAAMATLAGVLLLADEPSDLAELNFSGKVALKADEGRTTLDFKGPIGDIVDQASTWMSGRFGHAEDRTLGERTDGFAQFYETFREAVVNALSHRDYRINNAPCQVVVRKESVEVISPGSPLVDPEELEQLTAPIRAVNPRLSHVLQMLKYSESKRLGLESFGKSGATVEVTPDQVVVTIPAPVDPQAERPRTVQLHARASNPEDPHGMIVYTMAKAAGPAGISTSQVGQRLGLSVHTARNLLTRLVRQGFLIHNGSPRRASRYLAR